MTALVHFEFWSVVILGAYTPHSVVRPISLHVRLVASQELSQKFVLGRYKRTGGAAQDVHVTPDYGPWKPTFSRSTTDWTQRGDTHKIEDDGGSSWKRLRSSPGLARDDDDEPWMWSVAAAHDDGTKDIAMRTLSCSAHSVGVGR